ALGVGPAMILGVVAGTVRFVASRGRVDRAIFDAGTLALAAAAGAGTYQLVAALETRPSDRFAPSLFAAAVFYVVNAGLVSLAMGLSEHERPFQIWKRRLRWTTPWAIAAGPFAAILVVVWQQIGVIGIIGMALAPWALTSPVRKLPPAQ